MVQGSPKTFRIVKTAAAVAMRKEQRLPVLKDKGGQKDSTCTKGYQIRWYERPLPLSFKFCENNEAGK